MPIRPFIRSGAFEPEMVAVMSEAFEAACKELDEAGKPKVARSHRRTNYCSGKIGGAGRSSAAGSGACPAVR
jgi:hypothetical protein